MTARARLAKDAVRPDGPDYRTASSIQNATAIPAQATARDGSIRFRGEPNSDSTKKFIAIFFIDSTRFWLQVAWATFFSSSKPEEYPAAGSANVSRQPTPAAMFRRRTMRRHDANRESSTRRHCRQ